MHSKAADLPAEPHTRQRQHGDGCDFTYQHQELSCVGGLQLGSVLWSDRGDGDRRVTLGMPQLVADWLTCALACLLIFASACAGGCLAGIGY